MRRTIDHLEGHIVVCGAGHTGAWVCRELLDTRRPLAFSVLINDVTTARGGIHDELALADAIRDDHIAGAGLDVWAEEPPSPKHPLMAFDNVLVSPHTAGVSHESRENVGRSAAEQIGTVCAGKRPPRLLNPEAFEHFAERWEARFGQRPG